ncbi:MAG: hypothetical protein ACD_19C00014G0032 [uncultured bacterium]|nr:MAG: hypothetical protein ACD_19C00014G0032 [uncultured bacterium]
MNKFKKIVLILISSLLIFNSSALPVLAEDPPPSTWYNQGFTDWYAKVYGDESPPSEIFGERYTAAQVQWILYSLFSFPINFLGSNVQGATSCLMAAASAGINIRENVECVQKTIEIITDLSTFFGAVPISSVTNNQTKLGFSQSMFGDFQKRPLSGIKYLSILNSKFSIISTANAQGFGFNAVDGLQRYWQGFRDIAYALTVLVVIVFAFMIMFRVKLSPQLVISVQSALPKVFMALVLATFSYAIAGFVIDLSYVVGGLFSALMHSAGFSGSFAEAYKVIVPSYETEGVGAFYIFFWMFGYTVMFFLAAIWSLVGTVSGLSVYGFLASLLMILMSIWVLILMLWYTIRVPWVLLKNLISLFVSIVVAPVQIMIGALVPTIGFGVWFKKIITEALVFPLTGLFMFLALKTLVASFAASTGQSVFAQLGLLDWMLDSSQQSLWTPPILGSAEDMAGILWLAVSFMFITMIPKAVDIMKMLVMGAKFDFGSAMGEAMGAFGILPTAQKMGGAAVADMAGYKGYEALSQVAQKRGWDNFKAMLDNWAIRNKYKNPQGP